MTLRAAYLGSISVEVSDLPQHMIWLKKLRIHYRLRHRPARLNLGAGGTNLPGWISTDIDTLNLLDRTDWLCYVKPESVDAMLAEHVWEHLTESQGLQAAALCLEFLRPGGNLRVAVPDGFNPDPGYLEHVRPGGSGPGADDHKVLYTHVTFGSLFASAGFEVKLLEYWDAEQRFHAKDWDPGDGIIHRSKRYDSRNQGGVLGYTSLILDAKRPSSASM